MANWSKAAQVLGVGLMQYGSQMNDRKLREQQMHNEALRNKRLDKIQQEQHEWKRDEYERATAPEAIARQREIEDVETEYKRAQTDKTRAEEQALRDKKPEDNRTATVKTGDEMLAGRETEALNAALNNLTPEEKALFDGRVKEYKEQFKDEEKKPSDKAIKLKVAREMGKVEPAEVIRANTIAEAGKLGVGSPELNPVEIEKLIQAEMKIIQDNLKGLKRPPEQVRREAEENVARSLGIMRSSQQPLLQPPPAQGGGPAATGGSAAGRVYQSRRQQ